MSEQTSNPWKDQIVDHLVIWHIYRAVHEDDPEKALQDLLNIETSCALDPSVSKAAQALVQEGFDKAIASFIAVGTTESGDTLYRRINFEKPPGLTDISMGADLSVHGSVLSGSLGF